MWGYIGPGLLSGLVLLVLLILLYELPNGPHYVIGDDQLRRWFIIPRNRYFNIYLHHIMKSDDDRALHDHPWSWNLSIPFGTYWEALFVYAIPDHEVYHRGYHNLGEHRLDYHVKIRDPFVPIFRRGPSPHGVIISEPMWSLFLTGPIVRRWGFYTPQGWVDHRQYLNITYRESRRRT